MRELRVQGGQILAQVQGSRPHPCQVEISVPGVQRNDAQRLMDALTQDPGQIARLHNRELDPDPLQSVALLISVPSSRHSRRTLAELEVESFNWQHEGVGIDS